LNPGAPEFTPRSAATPRATEQSPLKRVWAEDVSTDSSLSTLQQSTLQQSVTAVIGRDLPYPADHVAIADRSEQHEQALAQHIESSGVGEPVLMADSPLLGHAPFYKNRRNTIQSLSCPEPTSVFCGTSGRSVSTPVPPPLSPQGIVPDEDKTDKSPRTMSELKQPSPPPRPQHQVPVSPSRASRGVGSRARNLRGRYWGRGKRNISNHSSGLHRPRENSEAQSITLSGTVPNK
jgi:hypothetical protein